MRERRRRAALRAAYLRSLRRQLAEARADVCDLVDAILPPDTVIRPACTCLACTCLACTAASVEDDVREFTLLPPMVAVRGVMCIAWGRA